MRAHSGIRSRLVRGRNGGDQVTMKMRWNWGLFSDQVEQPVEDQHCMVSIILHSARVPEHAAMRVCSRR